MKEIELKFICRDNFISLSVVPNLEKLTVGCYGDKFGLISVNVRGKLQMLRLRSLSLKEP